MESLVARSVVSPLEVRGQQMPDGRAELPSEVDQGRKARCRLTRLDAGNPRPGQVWRAQVGLRETGRLPKSADPRPDASHGACR